MKVLELPETGTGFSDAVADAERGQSTMVTRNGRPAAMVVPLEPDQRQLAERPDFAELLLSIPFEPEIVRLDGSFREIDL